MNPRIRRVALLVTIIAATASAALAATPALAARTYDSQITGFTEPSGATVDPADNLWIADRGNGGLISEYDGYPSQTLLGTQTGGGHFQGSGSGIESLAVNGSSGFLYVSDAGNQNLIDIFDNTGAFVKQLNHGFGNNNHRVAVDNSGGASQGRIYDGYNYNPMGVQAFDPAGFPHSFECGGECPSYIEGNTITGTPGGPFADVQNLAVDSHGNIYVVDPPNVDEFDSTGTFVQTFTGAGVAGGFSNSVAGVAIDPTNGNVLVVDAGKGVVDEFDSTGAYLDQLKGTGPLEETPFGGLSGGIAVNSSGYVYLVDRANGVVDIFTPLLALPQITYKPVTSLTPNSATLGANIDPNGGGDVTACHFEYGTTISYSSGTVPCSPDPASSPPGFSVPTDVSAGLTNLQAGTTYHYRVVVTDPNGTRRGPDRTLPTPPAVNGLSTGLVTELTQKSATLNASFTGEENLETTYWFEYGTSTNYGHKSPEGTLPGPATPTETKNVSAPIAELVSNTTYHYRFVAENTHGITPGEDKTFTTYQPPTIEAFSSSNVTATSADLEARIDPQGLPAGVQAECHFEYGPTTAYGQSAPCPEKLSGTTGRSVKVEIEDLQPGLTYHFRLVAENQWGTVTSEDQSFEFFPSNCPNSAVRQQTGSAYLPDCRAYELVSPGNANGTLLFSGGPNTGQATSPSRFSFVGAYSSLPGAGEVIGTTGDLYVSTRTNTGWVSRYVGLPGNQAGCVGGPPNSPWSHASFADKNQDFVLADPAMDRVLDFNDGSSLKCFSTGNGTGDANRPIDPASSAPYLWSSEGALLAHLPTDFAATPGAAAALACPDPGNPGAVPVCSGDVAASGDLTHLAFSSNEVDFAEGEEAGKGLTEAPGSAYDNDLATGTVKLISVLPNGHNIPQDPSFAKFPRTEPQNILLPGGKEEFIRFPAVSTDGSRILMSTATAPTPSCASGAEPPIPAGCPRFTDTPIHLYMRVHDAATYEIAESPTTHEPAAVDYVGATPDASKVYFTSEQHLTHEDEGHAGTSLFVWSAEKAENNEPPLTLISKANPGSAAQAGDTAACEPALVETAKVEGFGTVIYEELPWVAQCGVLPYSSWSYASAQGGRGGNSISDTAIAANGDIYFYSPEQLDGDRGVPGQQNLYDYRYREGKVRFVATFAPGHTCATGNVEFSQGPRGGLVCSAGPIARLEVSADDSHMAFVTADRLTSYDNTDPHGSCQDNFGSGEPTGETQCTEMYSYTPSSGAIVCDSCNPDGQPPSTDVWASQDGLFMTEDGRTFFSTAESLVPSDTNRGIDVYEFVDGRPQLITPGTGTASAPPGVNLISLSEVPGLVGVSANGTDVYFSTYDTLTSEDHNGDFLKFYDARTDGGFPQPPPVQPCVAAEECHGPGTEVPTLPQITSNGATTTGGNATPEKNHAHKHKKRKRAKHKRHNHRANTSRGGRK